MASTGVKLDSQTHEFRTSAMWAALPHKRANKTKRKGGKWATVALSSTSGRAGVFIADATIKQVRYGETDELKERKGNTNGESGWKTIYKHYSPANENPESESN